MAVQQLPTTLVSAMWPVRTDAAGRDFSALLRAAVLALVGSALLTVSAKVAIPFNPVPMTMQTLVVLLLGAAYGWPLAVATVALYLIEGALGLPVFAGTPQLGLGLPYMAGPTGGFLVGFLAGAGLVGWLCERGLGRSIIGMATAMTLGHAAIFAFGFGWLATLVGPQMAWDGGVAPFYMATALKTGLGAMLVPAFWSLADRKRG